MKYINLSGTLGSGVKAIVDDEDYPRLLPLHWWMHNHGYAYTKIRNKSTTMQRLILDQSDRLALVDHINGNRLDNRKSNLRLASQAQNLSYKGKILPRNKSGYKGVVFEKRSKKNPWVAYIKSGEVRKNLGAYPTKEKAALAYNNAAKALHGEFAYLNKIKKEPAR